MTHVARSLVLVLTVVILSACERIPAGDRSPDSASNAGIKNVIIMIGDGMGPQQMGLLVTYAHHAPHSVYGSSRGKTALERIMEEGTLGYSRIEPADALVTDSGASSTQMASGESAGPEMIGIDRHGNAVKTILETARDMGKSTGLVTDTRITHATPAGFAAHQTHRSKEDKIAEDLLEAGVDVMLAGGLKWWIPRDANNKDSKTHQQLTGLTGGSIKINSRRKDSRNLLEEARAKGYELCFDRIQLEEATRGRILGLFAHNTLMNGIEETRTKDDPGRTIPTLREMTAKALEVLSRNANGFFLMVEAGLIDWAAHDNDTGTLLHEMIKFDETIACVHRWAQGREDTLILVTADHETGGFGFSHIPGDRPAPQTLPGAAFHGEVFQPRNNFGNYRILDRIYDQKLSYPEIMARFDALPMDQQTPKTLAKIIDEFTEFPITEVEAATILGRGQKADSIGRQAPEGGGTLPEIHGYREFFPSDKGLRANLLARVVSKAQMTVWATGMHTNTPVPLIAYGPPLVTSRYGKMMHTTEWGRETIEILTHGE